MTERIEELIVAYLHRGSTPEQERELFEACGTHPEVAGLLRQHITLSLKLRMLRDKTQVPLETHNALIRRINEARVSETLPAANRFRWSIFGAGTNKFGWRHLTGTALATAAAVIALFLLGRPTGAPDRDASSLAAAWRTDTVLLTRTDTVVQTRTITRPVYIVRHEMPAPAHQESAGRQLMEVSPADLASQAPADAPFVDPHLIERDKTPVMTPSIAETRQQETPAYIQQYTSMVTSLEKIRLSYTDRVRE